MFKKPTIIWGVEELYHPDPDTISEGACFSLLQRYLQIPNIPTEISRKWIGLKSLGLEDERIEELCKPIEYDEEEMMKAVAEESKREQKHLKKWDKQRKSQEERDSLKNTIS